MATATASATEEKATHPRAQDLWPWLFPFETGHVTQWYNPPEEYGIDIGLPQGTPITSLTEGRVLGVGYPACPGGVVSIESVVQGEIVSVYYQHLDQVVVNPGDHISVGQLIAYSGGQLSGGNHPAQRLCSSGPHIEIGVNAPWGGVWHPLGRNRNPTPWLAQLIQSPGVSSLPLLRDAVSLGRQVTLSFAPGFLGMAQQFHEHEKFIPPDTFQPSINPISDGVQAARITGRFLLNNLETFTIRAMVVLAGILLIVAAVWSAYQRMVEVEARNLNTVEQSFRPVTDFAPGGGGAVQAATAAAALA